MDRGQYTVQSGGGVSGKVEGMRCQCCLGRAAKPTHARIAYLLCLFFSGKKVWDSTANQSKRCFVQR